MQSTAKYHNIVACPSSLPWILCTPRDDLERQPPARFAWAVVHDEGVPVQRKSSNYLLRQYEQVQQALSLHRLMSVPDRERWNAGTRRKYYVNFACGVRVNKRDRVLILGDKRPWSLTGHTCGGPFLLDSVACNMKVDLGHILVCPAVDHHPGILQVPGGENVL